LKINSWEGSSTIMIHSDQWACRRLQERTLLTY
jgi:hypothetical protein